MGDRPKTTDNVLATNCEDFSYVEFYSGIGGWTMALEEAVRNWSSSDDNTHQSPQRQLHLRRIAALDHSDLCMRVFQHNFGSDKKSFQIERLTLKQVEEWRATVWMMSPPCQPHTRQHSNQQKDLFDSRSSSFLHICSLISQMKEDTLPRLILCENVVGFENSNSFQKWRTALAERDYYVGHFHLSPTQVGMPNDRPRYYCVAVQKTALTDSDEKASLLEVLQQEDAKNDGPSKIYTSIPGLGSRVPKMYQISSFLDKEPDDALVVPENLLKSNAAWCFDIITPNDRRSSCFTSAYGRYIRGTGSILYNDNNIRVKLLKPEEREFQEDWGKDYDFSKLRYFSGLELSRLFGFRDDFSFPSNCTRKQQWKLVGNSLNVRVAARLIDLGLRSIR